MNSFTQEDFFLVTGASSGIGRAVALLLNELGATVLAHGRDAARLEEVRSAATTPSRIFPESRELTLDMPGLPLWLRSLVAKYSLLRGMVCCAGITWNAPMSLYDYGKSREIFDICCHAPLMLGSAFCDRRNNTGPGAAVVFIAAAAAVDPNPGQGIYAAAKAGLVGGARCLAKEAASRGIRVNCVSPGLVESPMMDATVQQLGKSFLEREQNLYPLGFGLPDDVAHLTAFLLSSNARWLTGQNILLSGGR